MSNIGKRTINKETWQGVCSIHFNMCKEIGVQSDKENCYQRAPKSVVTSHERKVTIICHQQVQTARIIASNEPDIIIRDNARKEHVRWELLQFLENRNPAHVECENKSDTGNNRGNWHHLKITQPIPDQQTWKSRNQRGTTENSHTGHCTHTPTADSADV